MNSWLHRQFSPIGSVSHLVVVLDPERLADPGELETWGKVVTASDWYALRRAYEQDGRRRPPEAPRLLILVTAGAYIERRDLPFDIEHAATVIRLRMPVAAQFRHILLELDDDQADRAVRVLGPPRWGDIDDLVADLWGVQLPRDPDESRELEAVVQLRGDPTVPEALWPVLRERLASPMPLALAATPPDTELLQARWDDFARAGAASPYAGTFERVGPRVMSIFHTGLLRPSPKGTAELPSWAAAGLGEISPAELFDSVLGNALEAQVPADLTGWIAVAEWWGQVRAAMAYLGVDHEGRRERAWAQWSALDRSFIEWLRGTYGGVLLSAVLPQTVNRIPDFLARRLRQDDAQRILLVVLDGLGMSQWAIIRRRMRLRVVESRACLAMIPTLTPISRQAIFRGALPRTYAETIEKTDSDAAGWSAFWTEQGIPAKAVTYRLVTGADPEPLPLHPGLTSVGVVIQAIDKMLHGANVLGDAQLASVVDTWLDHGMLESLVIDADAAGFEVWLTSDHGNLETTPLGQAYEGLGVDTAGLRVRLYQTDQLRESSRLRDGGIPWDPPGLPDGWRYPLFPSGRGAYFSGEVRVTHGGLSLDEVIVPLVRMAP